MSVNACIFFIKIPLTCSSISFDNQGKDHKQIFLKKVMHLIVKCNILQLPTEDTSLKFMSFNSPFTFFLTLQVASLPLML